MIYVFSSTFFREKQFVQGKALKVRVARKRDMNGFRCINSNLSAIWTYWIPNRCASAQLLLDVNTLNNKNEFYRSIFEVFCRNLIAFSSRLYTQHTPKNRRNFMKNEIMISGTMKYHSTSQTHIVSFRAKYHKRYATFKNFHRLL